MSQSEVQFWDSTSVDYYNGTPAISFQRGWLGDRTPAEKAGIKFPFKDWMDVVRGKEDKPSEVIDIDEPHRAVFEARGSPRVRHKPKRVRKREKVMTSLRGLR